MKNKVQFNAWPVYKTSISYVEDMPKALSQKRRHAIGSSAKMNSLTGTVARQTIIQTGPDIPEARNEVVEAIKRQIEEGTYKIDTGTLADRLLPLLRRQIQPIVRLGFE
jgi:anti-sigma28 factor (negative regulator of flagellin synthesis)